MAKGTKPVAKPRSRSWRDNAIVRYLREARAEVAKVTWPTREEAIRLTGIVLAVTVTMAAFLGIVDAIFATLFRLILGT